MKDEPKTKATGHLTLAVCAAVLLPVLYVLSLGPVWVLADAGYITSHQYEVAYAPVWGIAKPRPAIKHGLVSYLRLWTSDALDDD